MSIKTKPIDFLVFFYLIAWTISPPLQVGMAFRLAGLGCAAFLFYRNRISLQNEQVIALFFVVLVAFNEYIAAGTLSSILSQMGIYMLFIGYAMNAWYRDRWREFSLLVPMTLILLSVWNIITVNEIVQNPNIARDLVRSNEELFIYLKRGVGGYGLVYSQVIIVPAILSWILHAFKGNKLCFACGVVWLLTFVELLNESGYSIAVIAAVIGVIVLFFYKPKSVVPAIAVSIVLIIGLVYLIGYNHTVQNYLLTVFDGTKVATKITDISSTVTTGETADSIASRLNVYAAGLRQMFNYPIIGSWWNKGASSHSAIMDAFTIYGVFGGVVMCRMLFCVPMMWKKKQCSPAVLHTVNGVMVSIFFVTLLDSVTYNFDMMLMVILPIILSDIEVWSKKNESIVDCQPDSG